MRLLNNVVVRRAVRAALQVPRAIRRLGADADDYRRLRPILANSMPKSGTHLLLQVAAPMPGVRGYGSFLASQPVFPYSERSSEQTVRMIRRFAPGELVGGHVFHGQAAREALAAIQAAHLFIYRDLRDVAISEAYYLTHMNRFHRMHRYFRYVLHTTEDRVMAAIRGVPANVWPHEYPDIAMRFQKYAAWIEDPTVCAVRYEELIGDGRAAAIRRIVRHVAPSSTDATVDELVEAASRSIQPERSHTFREGRAGGWRSVFTQAHRDAFGEATGSLMAGLGYLE